MLTVDHVAFMRGRIAAHNGFPRVAPFGVSFGPWFAGYDAEKHAPSLEDEMIPPDFVQRLPDAARRRYPLHLARHPAQILALHTHTSR